MEKTKIAILGAGNIGKYHVREFMGLGADVVAILGSTKESSIKTAQILKEKFNVKVTPYYALEELLKKEQLNAVSICTPPEMHENQIESCLMANLHVMCEKPLIQSNGNNYEIAKKLFNLADNKNKILTINTQWASIINYLGQYDELKNPKRISIHMEPGKKGIEMLRDHLPHTNSILTRIIPNGKAEEIDFPLKTDKAITIRFKYKKEGKICDVIYDFKFKKDRPRQIIFSLNKKTFRREIGKGYEQRFVCNDGSRFEIKDPLTISIDKFLRASEGIGTTLINKKEILENIVLGEEIINEYIFEDIKTYKQK
jgi:hypothetical protein